MATVDTKQFALSQLPTSEDQDHRFEFKSSRTPPKELGKKLGCAVSGFANSGGGIFVAGVDDETGNADGGLQIDGFVGRQTLRAWTDQIIQSVKPTPQYKIELVESADNRGTIDSGKAVLVVFIEESHYGPHMAQDHIYYIRAGVHTVPAEQFIVEAIWAKRHLSKPRITHLVRERPDDAEVIQIGLVALTDSPALDVELTLHPLPGLLKGTNSEAFPLKIGMIDRHFPLLFDITTHSDAERHRDEEFGLVATYRDLEGKEYKYEKTINLFRSLSSLRFQRKGLNEIAEALEDIQKTVGQLSKGSPSTSK